MFMNILIVILVLVIGYAWMVRGVFSAMLHALCAIIAGAIAFGFWEPLSLMLVNASPERGFFSFLESIAWGVALIVPFAVIMLLLRLATDKLIPGNIKNAGIVDYTGGAVFGIVTGVICTGVLAIGIGNMRVSTEFLGYQPLWYSADRATGAGSLVKSDSLWVPVDSVVSKMYGNLSQGSMSSAEPLAYWYPELELTGFASRVSPEGMGRNALRPEDFNLRGTYTVGPEQGTQVSELLKIDGDVTQRYVDINNESVTTGRVFGYVIEFEPSAKERGRKGAGQLVVSNGQIRMLAENAAGETFTIFPNAVISESSEPGQFGRWRFDAADVFINSTGGKSKVTMGFEFVVPSGSTPAAIFVKNIRIDSDEFPNAVSYPNVSRRDRLVRTGSILRSNKAEVEYNTEYTVTYNPSESNTGYVNTSARLLEILPLTSARRGMTIEDNGNLIVGGQGTYDVKEEVGRKNAGTSKELRVERYAVGNDQAIVKLDVGSESPFGFLTEGVQVAPLDQPLVLLDTMGNEYEAVGYEYMDSSIMELRYTLGNTLTGIDDTPSLSTTRADQRLRIIFIVTKGVELDRFVIGDMVIARFTPPIEPLSN